ncbi:MAG: serine/threonine-protein kinase [Armatimonadota bacterium]
MSSQIGRYQIVRELGRGAMGIVYEARDPQLGRAVAVKVLSVAQNTPPAERRQALERFLREGKAAGSLLHPNIAQVFDMGEDQGRPYLVMELCEGTTLRDVLSFEHHLPEQRVRRIAEQLLSALELAHARGIVHRDIKPDNIVLSRDDTLKLMDFGIARLMQDSTLTQTGQVLGSPAYMSPEQVLGKPVDARSDLFSVGVVLYECLTGRKPFDGPTITAVTHKIAFEDPPPMAGVSPFWQSFVLRALAKDPAARFQSASQMTSHLLTGKAPATPQQPSAPASGGATWAGPPPPGQQPFHQTQAVMGGAPPAGQPGIHQTQVVMGGAPPPFQTFPQQSSYQPQPPPDSTGARPPGVFVRPHRGETILILGILGLLCCVPLALAAWLMGSSDLNEINAGRMDRAGHDMTQAGMICGIIGTVLGGVWFFLALAVP